MFGIYFRFQPSSRQAWLHTNSLSPAPPPGTPVPLCPTPLPLLNTTPLPHMIIPHPPSSRAPSQQQQQQPFLSSTVDQDYEDISSILQRLQESEHHFLLPSVSLTCKCPSIKENTSHVKPPQQSHTSKNSDALISSSEDESDSDSDEEESESAVLSACPLF